MAKKTDAEKRREERRAHQKLERRLVLLAWLNRQLGFDENRDLLKVMKEAGDGFDDEGRSYVAGMLLGRGEKSRIPRSELERYDANIGRHLAHINRLRTRPIVLRYFQHLALLCSEIYLDHYFGERKNLLAGLNTFVRERNGRKLASDPEDSLFKEADLRKLAYWMATGSGKTLLLHINYLQFLHYARRAKEPIDNILLITPNENLTEQHLDEMAVSDIPCARFTLEESGLNMAAANTVRVLEITKLVTEKKGSGVSVPVEAFEGHNLVFVDEGHKGTGSEAETWRKRRLALGDGGFTFEYSATFGQALDASKKDEVTDEYAKSILFDYSYRYFYGDGYGKDFYILNLKDYEDTESIHTLLLANLLSFYEQRKFHHQNESRIRDYLLEPPLWLQICSRVSATNAEVVMVMQFLARFLLNRGNWGVKKIEAILESRSGIELEDGQDLFKGQLSYLRRGRVPGADKVYHDILSHVFQAGMPGELEILVIKAGRGEVGLRVAGTEAYFGLLYIGDVNAFKKILDKEAPELEVKDDLISTPLFPTVKHPSSKVNLLIGAKKFMEGWSSWRVSNIGLLNVGVSEGSEIIQLFGRGVRLKGHGFNLKRSSAITGESHPEHLKVLERLSIFAVRANYMARFRNYLEREGVDTGGYIEFELPLWNNKPFLKEKLYRPRISSDRSFEDEVRMELTPSADVRVALDVTTRVRALQSAGGNALHEAQAAAGHPRELPESSVALVDWQRVHVELAEYKRMRGYHNLAIPYGVPRRIIEASNPSHYDLRAPDQLVKPRTADHRDDLQDAVVALLRKYLDKFYLQAKQRWESRHMSYTPLTLKEENFQDYRVSVPRSDAGLVQKIDEVLEETRKLRKRRPPKGLYGPEEQLDLPNIHFDRHLYQPLLVARDGSHVKLSPPGLNAGERQFVTDLRAYCNKETTGELTGKELFLLRNLGRGKGIGFFDNQGFYPDFILWIKEGPRQRIVFIEPHGMMLEQGNRNNEKLSLHRRLRDHSKAALTKLKSVKLDLDAYVVSVTPYDDLYKHFTEGDWYWSLEDFAKEHVLFQHDTDYINRILR